MTSHETWKTTYNLIEDGPSLRNHDGHKPGFSASSDSIQSHNPQSWSFKMEAQEA